MVGDLSLWGQGDGKRTGSEFLLEDGQSLFVQSSVDHRYVPHPGEQPHCRTTSPVEDILAIQETHMRYEPQGT